MIARLVYRARFGLALVAVFALGLLAIDGRARATTWTPPGTPLTVVRCNLRWTQGSAIRTLTLCYNDAAGNTVRREDITIDATNALDRFGNVLVATGAPFQTALGTIETSIDSAVATLAAASKLSPPQ